MYVCLHYMHTHQILFHLLLSQMAGIAGADELEDRQRFRSFFRTDASSRFVGPALAEMARRFNWTQMAIISHTESLFTGVCDTL